MAKTPKMSVTAFTGEEMMAVLAAVEGTIDLLEDPPDGLTAVGISSAKEMLVQLKSVKKKIRASVDVPAPPTYPAHPCPHCKKVLNAATGIDHGLYPKPGDLTICIGCAECLQFGENLTLIKPSEDTMRALPHDVKVALEKGRKQVQALWKNTH